MRFPWQSQPSGPQPHGERIVLDPAAETEVLRGILATLTLEQLTAGWISSDAAMVIAREQSRTDQLVRLRGLLLDQLEKRYPRSYDVWLRRGGPDRRSTNLPG
jgi:hypothetical protein